MLTRQLLCTLVVCCLAAVFPSMAAQVEYVGSISVTQPLTRIVADPVRPMVYGFNTAGDIVFINVDTMQVQQVFSTGRKILDLDIDPSNQTLYALDNVTNDMWNQPPAVYVLKYDLPTQTAAGMIMVQAPMYQMATGRPGRLLGVETNQWVDAFLVDSSSGQRLSTCGAGYAISCSRQYFVSTRDGNTLFKTETGLSSTELYAFDVSTDTMKMSKAIGVTSGSYASLPICLNSTDTSLYVGNVRRDPQNITNVLGIFPETICAATGDDTLAFGVNNYYDPSMGTILGGMPVHFDQMGIGYHDTLVYSYDATGKKLHVMSIPEPGVLLVLLTGASAILRRRK